MTERDLDEVLADGDVGHVGEDARLARSSVRVHREYLLEVSRFRRLVLGYLRHQARPWAACIDPEHV